MGRYLCGTLRYALTAPAPILQPRGWDMGQGSPWCGGQVGVHRTILAPHPSASRPTPAYLASCRGKNKGSMFSGLTGYQDSKEQQAPPSHHLPPSTSLLAAPQPEPRKPTHPTVPSVWLKPSLLPCLHPMAPRPRPSFLLAERSPIPAPLIPLLSPPQLTAPS